MQVKMHDGRSIAAVEREASISMAPWAASLTPLQDGLQAPTNGHTGTHSMARLAAFIVWGRLGSSRL